MTPAGSGDPQAIDTNRPMIRWKCPECGKNSKSAWDGPVPICTATANHRSGGMRFRWRVYQTDDVTLAAMEDSIADPWTDHAERRRLQRRRFNYLHKGSSRG